MKFNAAFWKWFGDSKVVDDKGRPLVVYHGSPFIFRSFKAGKARGGLIYFSKSRDEAIEFADWQKKWMLEEINQKAASVPDLSIYDGTNRIYEIYVKLENPFDGSNAKHVELVISKLNPNASEGKKEVLRDHLKSSEYDTIEHVAGAIRRSGFDGAYVRESDGLDDSDIQLAVFHPTQIKSAIGNDGSWDADDPDIRSNPSLEWIKKKSYKTTEGSFEEYFLDGSNRNGIITVELDRKKGYRIRNIFVDTSLMRQGHATNGYRIINAESIRRTGKPLRSSEIGYARRSSVTSMSPDAEALWTMFVRNGEAELAGDHFEFLSLESDAERILKGIA